MVSKIQAVMFDKSKWKTKDARAWLKRNKMKPISRIRHTKNYFSYRLVPPSRFKRFRIKPERKYGILFIIGFQ